MSGGEELAELSHELGGLDPDTDIAARLVEEGAVVATTELGASRLS
ncbi:hypothetical protein [Nocardia sp. NPDC049526]